jgi:acyl-coenzyme A synthetase/AMP-(fatty) acid ligase
MLRSPNVPPALFTNFGALRLGAVMVPTSPMLSPNEIAHIANNAEAKVIVVAAAFLEGVAKARPNLKTVKHSSSAGSRRVSAGFPTAARRNEAASLSKQLAHCGLVLHSRNDWHAQGTAHYMGGPDRPGRSASTVRSPGDTTCGPPPFRSRRGLTQARSPRFAPRLSDPQFTPRLFEQIQTTRSRSWMPATAYRKMLEVQGAEKYDLSSLRVLTAAAIAGRPDPSGLEAR